MINQPRFTELMHHPLYPDLPMERAEVIDYYREDGRSIGLFLEFEDGHQANLTFNEIGKLEVKEAIAQAKAEN